MNETFGCFTINKRVKNINDLLKRYNKTVERHSNFSYSLIEDRLVANYFKFCVDGDIEVDEYLKTFNISEPKELFVSRAQEVLAETKKKYFAELERKIDLHVWFEFDEYTPRIIKKICEFVSVLQERNNKSLQLEIGAWQDGFKKNELKCLLDLCEILHQDIPVLEGVDGYELRDSIPLSKVIDAYAKMEKLVDKINGQNLSPFEKFLLVHDYAASRIYKFEKNAGDLNSNIAESRNFVNVMTGDAIVCAGYAQIVKTFCKRLGIDCEYLVGTDQESYDEIYHKQGKGHAANIVHIVDEKYGIDGYYFCDACWDAKKDNGQTYKEYFYAALPIQDIDGVGQAKYFSNVVKNMNIPQSSTPISIDTFRRALNTVYSDPSQVEDNLREAVKDSYYWCSHKSENSFIKECLRQREQNAMQ